MGYKNFVESHGNYIAEYDCSRTEKLPQGHYQLAYIPEADRLIFKQMKFTHDELLELPSKEFETVTNQIDKFLTPESKKTFKEYGFLYKRSILLHGVPGTGKTCLVNRISNKVVNDGGIVLFNPDPRFLPKAFEALTDNQPETTIVVVFEELDQLAKYFEEQLLNILDGEIQRENVIYLATTNYIDKVPARILRPGRFASVVEVKFPDIDSRRFYLNYKIGKLENPEEIEKLVLKTDNLSIDELKEVVLSTRCLKIELNQVMTRIKETRELGKDKFDNAHRDYEQEEQFEKKYSSRMTMKELQTPDDNR